LPDVTQQISRPQPHSVASDVVLTAANSHRNIRGSEGCADDLQRQVQCGSFYRFRLQVTTPFVLCVNYSGLGYNEGMLQRTVFINKIRMLQRTQMLQRTNTTTKGFSQQNKDATKNTDATTNEYYNEEFLPIK
jgi:hypothetical protein